MTKQVSLIVAWMAVLVVTGCKSLSKLTAKDHSNAKTSTASNNTGQQRSFLDQIEVTPGTAVASRHKASTTNAGKTAATGNTANTAAGGSNPPNFTGFDIERAGYLQLKYAVLMDATVEKLSNIPLLETIDRWWGTKYCLGGSSESCIDCSAFTQILMRDVYGSTLPRTSQEQYDNTTRIELEDLQEGDLVFFHTTGRKRDITHVGIYLLNNKFVHAATSGGVMISDLNDKYWQPRYRGAGRATK
jgi:lipoprotein Spr